MNELKKVEDYLKQVDYFSVATVDGDKPKCRPLAFHLFLNDRLYFGVGTFKDVYKQLVKNPNVEICACNGENFLRYYGEAEFEKRLYDSKYGFEQSTCYAKNIQR